MSFLEGNAHSDKDFASDAMFKSEIRDEMLVACIVLSSTSSALRRITTGIDFHLIHGHITQLAACFVLFYQHIYLLQIRCMQRRSWMSCRFQLQFQDIEVGNPCCRSLVFGIFALPFKALQTQSDVGVAMTVQFFQRSEEGFYAN